MLIETIIVKSSVSGRACQVERVRSSAVETQPLVSILACLEQSRMDRLDSFEIIYFNFLIITISLSLFNYSIA
jgi:hypothetical protein